MLRSELSLRKKPAGRDRYIIIDVSPSPGVVGLIISNLLTDSLASEKIGEIYSPHFPQVTLINNDGVASLPKVEIYEIKPTDKNNTSIILITRNFLIESSEAGEEVSELIFELLGEKKISEVVLLSSARISGTGDVFASSTVLDITREFLQLGAKTTPNIEALPIDKLASSLLFSLCMKGVPVSLLISDTISYMPDLSAAKKLINILSKYLGISIDVSKLDQEIEKQRIIFEEIERALREEFRERGGRPPSYIG
jgi:predicted ATP-grasp superfamily ATP-dependent carboligase